MERGTKSVLGLLVIAAVVVIIYSQVIDSGMIIPPEPDVVLISQTQSTNHGQSIGNNVNAAGQTFTLPEEKSITRIVFKTMYRTAAFTAGTAKCILYQCNANNLPSTIIQESEPVSLSSLTSSYTNITFTFSPAVKARGVIGGIITLVDPIPSDGFGILACYPGVYNGGRIVTMEGVTWLMSNMDAYFIVYGY